MVRSLSEVAFHRIPFIHPHYLEKLLPILQSNYIALEGKRKPILGCWKGQLGDTWLHLGQKVSKISWNSPAITGQNHLSSLKNLLISTPCPEMLTSGRVLWSALHFIPLGKTENMKAKHTFALPATLSFLVAELFLVHAVDFSVFSFWVPWKFLGDEFPFWRNLGICYRECQPQSHSDSDHVTFPHVASRWPSFLNLFLGEAIPQERGFLIAFITDPFRDEISHEDLKKWGNLFFKKYFSFYN